MEHKDTKNTSDSSEGVRTCVVCRAEGPRAVLVRFSAKSGCVAVDGKSGRGMYVCARQKCLLKVPAGFMGKVLKVSAEALSGWTGAALLVTLHAIAEQKLLQLLGLARRSDQIDWGVDGAFPGDEEDGFVFLSTDMGEKHEKRKPKHASVGVFLTGEDMGRAVGAGRVVALRIQAGLLAQQAAYWWNVWYETGEERKSGGVKKHTEHSYAKSGSDVKVGNGARS